MYLGSLANLKKERLKVECANQQPQEYWFPCMCVSTSRFSQFRSVPKLIGGAACNNQKKTRMLEKSGWWHICLYLTGCRFSEQHWATLLKWTLLDISNLTIIGVSFVCMSVSPGLLFDGILFFWESSSNIILISINEQFDTGTLTLVPFILPAWRFFRFGQLLHFNLTCASPGKSLWEGETYITLTQIILTLTHFCCLAMDRISLVRQH